MLITNFAAGELSENLFGRTDLPQYFSGVSRLENFDVIPTGGIKRRAGTERLAALPEEGRLIPFAVDRQNHFLLYLMPGKIAVIKNGSVRNVIESPEGLALYASLPEIREAQYAQNFDTLILVHENYPPLMAKYDKAGDSVTISAFEINYNVETKTAGEAGAVFETDKKHEHYLRAPGNYPRSVTFFNGRLVFAGTPKSPQRVFVSKVNDIHSFATYKLFLTEQKEYISVFGNAFDGSDTITLAEGQSPKFVKPLYEYYADTPYFPRKYTKPLEFLPGNGKQLRLSNAASIPGALTQQELNEINGKIARFEAAEQNKREYAVGRVDEADPYHWTLYARIGARSLIVFKTGHSYEEYPVSPLPDNAAEFVKDNADYLVDCIKAPIFWAFPGDLEPELFEGTIRNAANAWAGIIRDTMQMNFRGEWLYDTPHNIKAYIMANSTQGIDSYMPFYTRTIIEDRYPAPDDGFTFEIASDMADAIRWIAVNKGVIIGTETAEWIIPPGVTAVNVYAALNSRYGSDTVQGAVIGDAACFFQAGKKALAEYYIPQQDNNFRANNMAMLSPAMLAESPALEFDFARSPYSKLFITREDGTAVTLLYERGTGTFAWGRVTTAGEIKSAAVLPGADGNDDVYLAVERGGSHFLERLREAAAAYLDSFERWTGANGHYSDDALVLDGASGETWPKALAPAPEEGAVMWIGCPYASRARSMPVLANDRMKPNNIKTLLVRFLRSSMPQIKSLPNGVTDTVPREEPFSGITRIPFPGVWDTDVMFEFIHDKPAGCVILAINAEVN
jgi:hypothetical protein